MCRVFKLEIIESKEELEEQIKKEKDVRKRERIQFLYWYKTGQATTRKALAKIIVSKPIRYRPMERDLSRKRARWLAEP